MVEIALQTRCQPPNALLATFLGWQGWLFESPHACVLVWSIHCSAMTSDEGALRCACASRFTRHVALVGTTFLVSTPYFS
jgi:hypothetical protein